MAGHSKWHNIRVRKTKQDALKGKLFSKLTRELIVAARSGGGDPEMNPRLRHAIERAKEAGMPQESIERAIKRGTGELVDGEQLVEAIYEGYGPGGVAILIEAVTDNRNRTTSELRKLFEKHGGTLGEPGCVSWLFERRALVTVSQASADEDEVMQCAIEAGADDMNPKDDSFEIIAEPKQLQAIKSALESRNIPYTLATVTYIPRQIAYVDGSDARRLLKLLQELEDHDDVQNVSANFEMPAQIMEEFSEAA
ncbi:MAG: YebC/PmpR family DNA-binding transcriptional regulator [Armatimonadota bacterium]|nr:YebC/PmpR family DNA-binding transcriptional regulator [Armatimonadota bacterium]MCX7778296.1 YebC/PmpR family DNA-binding transcriptional regulator [Armatimonadota bacterium]MDW8026316.1 YebC/PmpR family DNA-binding transcriptional regulator [Armatimonadota bacterium]